MAAPTVSLYVPAVSATRMAPCPVSARLDVGAIKKSIRNATYTWSTVNTGTTVQYQVNAGNLDAQETAAGTFDGTGNNVTFSASTTASLRYVGEMIFPGVSIASGKAIISATLEPYIRSAGDDPECTIYCEDVDDAANFTTNADILGRTKTTANTDWSDENVTGGADGYVVTPDFSSALQEVYDRNGSLSSVNVGVIVEGKSSTNSGCIARSYELSGTSTSAKLNITYADAPLLAEYKLDTTLANLTDSGGSPSNIIVRENGSIMPEGTVGSLAAGEWGQSGGELYVRLSDDADPDSKALDYLDITYDVTLSGQGGSTNVGGSSPGWTVSTGSEYTLDTAIDQLAASIPNHSRIRIKEGSGISGAHLERGDAGSLNAGEFDIVHETLHVRLSDSSNPDTAAAADVVLEYELYPSGLMVEWEVNSSGSGVTNWGSRYRYSTDPRSETSSQQIDHGGKQTSGNGPNGLAYMWIFDVADTYTFSATVTNTAGESTTGTTSGVVIAADSRTEYTVAASGGDDTSLVYLIGTVGASTNDVKIIVEDGHTENVTAGITAITGNNWWITTETTTGTKPVLTYSDATDTGEVNFFDIQSENFVAERIAQAESTGNTGDGTGATIGIHGFDFNGTNAACVECEAQGNNLAAGSGGFRLFNAYTVGNCVGLLTLNCSTQYTRSYSIVGPDQVANDGEIVCAFGCDFGPSTNESTVRSLDGSSYWNISWNALTGDGSKSTLRWSWGYAMHSYGNSMLDGDNWTGSTVTTPAATEIRTALVRTEANKSTGASSAAPLIAGITQAVEGVFAVNNYLSSDTVASMSLGNAVSGSGQGHKKWGITFAHNTINGEDGYNANFFNGGSTNGELDHARNRVANSLFVHEDAADMTGQFLLIGSGIAKYNGNVWPATQTNLTKFADIYVSGVSSSTPANLAAWNALSFVGTDTETDVTLDADLIPDSPTTVTTEPGVHYDYYGNTRASTSYAGAVIAANPSSGGGSNRNLLLLGVG